MNPSQVRPSVSRNLCVFCGSHTGNQPHFTAAAHYFGSAMVRTGWGLVFGGGNIGLMGVLADAVLEARGLAIGVIPKALVDKELAHRGLTELHIVESMHQRKALMADLADAFVALPGGFGTGDELFEILTWAQLRIHAKPIGLLNTAGYFDPLLLWLDRMVTDGFLKPAHRGLLLVHSEPEPLFEALVGKMTPPMVGKSLDREIR